MKLIDSKSLRPGSIVWMLPGTRHWRAGLRGQAVVFAALALAALVVWPPGVLGVAILAAADAVPRRPR